MKKRISVFDNPIAEKRFLEHIKEKQKRSFENFKRKESRISGDNCSNQIINSTLEIP